MPGNKKPRKAYRPQQVNRAAHLQAMDAVTLLTPDEREKCASAPEEALNSFEFGIDPAFHWAVMADALNVAEALSDLGICSDPASKRTILQGQEVLASIYGHWSTTPGDSHDMAQAIEMHRIQLSLCDYSEYRKAIDLVTRKTRGAREGNAPAGSIVFDSTISP